MWQTTHIVLTPPCLRLLGVVELTLSLRPERLVNRYRAP